jgi:hypothetical protein
VAAADVVAVAANLNQFFDHPDQPAHRSMANTAPLIKLTLPYGELRRFASDGIQQRAPTRGAIMHLSAN